MMGKSLFAILAMMMLFPLSITGQATYRPGQTFSAGGSAPAPTATPYSNYRAPQQHYPQQSVQQQTRPVQRQAATPYNMQKKSVSSSSSSDGAQRHITKNTSNNSDKKLSVAIKDKPSTSEAHDATSHSGGKSESPEKSPEVVSKSEAKPANPESTDKLTFFSRKTGKKWIALTYDDGPNPTLTPELLDYLKANNVPATFYMLGEMVKTHPELTKRVAAEGFELANHTYDHPDLRKKSEDQIRKQLQETHDLIKAATGIDVKTMRPPFGAHNSKVDAICKEMGYKIILWDIDTEDWRKKSAETMTNTIMKQAGDGSIILMHDRTHAGRKTSLETTKAVVPKLRALGYTFVTVGQLLDLDSNATSSATTDENTSEPAIASTALAPVASPTPIESVTSSTFSAPLAVPNSPEPAASPVSILP